MYRISFLLIFTLIARISYSQSDLKLVPSVIKASSSYKEGRVENLIDGNTKTFWNPKNKKGQYGVGEYFEVEFDQAYYFESIRIFAGYGAAGFRGYNLNNRPSRISIQFDDESIVQYDLKDVFDFQKIFLLRKATKLKITIDKRIIGSINSRKRTFLISEVEFYAGDPAVTKNSNVKSPYIYNLMKELLSDDLDPQILRRQYEAIIWGKVRLSADDKKEAKTLLKDKIFEIVCDSIEKKLPTIPISEAGKSELEKFRYDYVRVAENLTNENVQCFKDLNRKQSEINEYLETPQREEMARDLEKVSKMSFHEMNMIFSIDVFARAIDFSKYTSSILVDEIRAETRKIKLEKIENEYDEIILSINEVTNLYDLEYLEYLYLGILENMNSDIIAEIRKEFEVRRNAIKILGNQMPKELLKTSYEKRHSMEKNGFYLIMETPENPEANVDFGIWKLFKGDFRGLNYSQDDYEEKVLISVIANQYMRIKAENCYANSDKTNLVPIYDKVCSTEEVVYNQYDVEINRYCIKYTQVPTGLYTTKDLSNAFEAYLRKSKGDMIYSTVEIMSNISKTKFTNSLAQQIPEDIEYLLEVNGCTSKAIQRFEENLVRYMNGQEPLILNYYYR